MSGPRSILTLFDLPADRLSPLQPVTPKTPALPTTPAGPASGPAASPSQLPTSANATLAPAPARVRVWSVTDLCRQIRQSVDKWGAVTVRGEVTNFKKHASGHWYFSIKDAGSSLQCAMFEGDNRFVRGFIPQDGMAVEVSGKVSFYEQRGLFQLLVQRISKAGEGQLAAAYEALRRKLESEGLFAQARKRPLPPLPRRVGVVTSLDGAALQDILNITRRRAPGISILIAPARVQGPTAASEVAQALRQLDRSNLVDVIILGRGGGSAEDLAAFNDENLARAVAACSAPVISAVGHETDVSICDWVADLRAPTPSAAAEMAVPNQAEQRQRVASLASRLARGLEGRTQSGKFRLLQTRQRLLAMKSLLQRSAHALDDADTRAHTALRSQVRHARDTLASLSARLQAAHPSVALRNQRARLQRNERGLVAALTTYLRARHEQVFGAAAALEAAHPARRLRQQREQWAALESRLLAAHAARQAAARRRWQATQSSLNARVPHARLAAARARISSLEGRLNRALAAQLASSQRAFSERVAKLNALSPLNVLQRGYAVVTLPDGHVVRDAAEAPAGTPLHIRLNEGSLSAVSQGPAPKDN